MRLLRDFSLCLAALVAMVCSQGQAQQPGTEARINAPVNDSERVTLKGNVPYLAKARYDQGEAEPSTQLTHMRLLLSRTPQQEADLEKYLGELQDKASPNFHKWLTPSQFGALFGPAEPDLAALTSWLQSHGLKIETVAGGRTNIAFSGTVSEVEEAFQSPIHSFVANGSQFYANIKDPQIPAALAPVVKGIAHLNTIAPKSYAVRGRPGVSKPDSKRLEPLPAREEANAAPQLTLGSASTGYFLYIVPGDAATIYDTPNTKFNANYTSGTSYSGSGVKIGIGGDALILAATVADYRTKFVGDSTQPTIINVDGVTSGKGALDEAYIDTELSGGLAPGAAIYFYTSTDLFSAIDKAITDNTVDIFSLSFGNCELDLSSADNSMLNSWWQQAASQGIAVTVSTGDSGSAGCDATSDSNGDPVITAVGGLAVSGFASTPYNIAVGGTDLSGLTSSFSTYVSTSQGTSATYYRSALSYPPESTWNDSTTSNLTIAQNEPWSAASGYENISSGAGGLSTCSTNTTVDTSTTYTVGKCSSGYAKPSWQRGIGVPADGARDLPDVSLMSGNGFNPATWLICSDDTTTDSGGATVTENCTKQTDGNFYFVGYGGTSTAAPAFAGILALVQQSTGSRLGQAAKNLYDLYNGPDSAAIFHDITVGNNSVPCTSGSLNCAANSESNYYLTGYDTNAGYDLATGLGSVDAKQLVSYWGSSTGAIAPTLTATPSTTTITSATGLTIAVTVTGTSAVPTGAVQLTGGGFTSPSEALVGGAYTFNIPAETLDVGADTLTISYSGDANYTSVSTTTVITVSGLTPTVTVTPSAASITANSQLTLVAAVAGTGSTPTGTVTLSGAFTSTAQPLTNGGYTFTIPAGSLSVGNSSFTVTYSGDPNYASATGTATVAVTASTATFSLTASAAAPASIPAGQTAISQITVNTSTGYTGTVILTCTPSATNPANASDDIPVCAVTKLGVAVGVPTPVSVLTLPAVQSSELKLPRFFDRRKGWTGAGGGAVLALLLFLGIPARRKSWRSMLGMLLALAALGSLAACGGGGGGGTKTPANPGTTPGTYVYTITGTGTPAPTSTPQPVTFSVVVTAGS